MPVFGDAVLDIYPSLQGASREVRRQLDSTMPREGKRAGEKLGGGVNKGLEKKMKGAGPMMAGALGGALGSLAGGALGGLRDGLNESIDLASDFNETASKAEQIFGSQSGAMSKWADGASKNLGMSKAAALEASSGFGDMFSQIGFSSQAAAGMSQKVVQMSADLGSFNNLPTADVADKISAAFRGEYDSLQSLIPNINAARVEQEAMRATGVKSAKQLTAQQKAAAVLAIVNKDGARAMGDFARTSDGVANKSKIVAARQEELKAKAGQALLPLKALALDGMGKLIDKLEASGPHFAALQARLGSATSFVQRHAGAFQLAGKTVAAIAGTYATARVAMAAYSGVVSVGRGVMQAYRGAVMLAKGAVDAYRLAQVVLVTVQNGTAAAALRERAAHIAKRVAMVATTAATKSMTFAQKALNLVMKMNPIGLVVTALIGLGIWLVKTYKTNETFRRKVNAAWDSVQRKTGQVWSFLRDKVLTPMKTFFTRTIPDAGRRARDGLGSAWDSMSRKSRQVWNSIRGMVLDPMKNFFTKTIPGAARTARDQFGKSWDGLKKKASDPVEAIVNTVYNDGLRGALNKIPGVDLKAFTFKGFDTGGYTGPGRKLTAAGIVHRGEYVMDQKTVEAAGGPGFFDNLRSHLRGYSNGGYVDPVPGRGNRHVRGYPWATWSGDFPVPMGTPIRAWKDGVVAMVKHLTTSYGKHTRINHTDGTQSLYAHQSQIKVQPGQKVSMGDIIGLVGSTGNSSGPHLHFETMRGAYSGGSGSSGSGFAMPDLLGPLKSGINKVKNMFSGLGEKFGPWGKLFGQMGPHIVDKALSFGKEKIAAAGSMIMDKAGDAKSWITGKFKGKARTGNPNVDRWADTVAQALEMRGLPTNDAYVGAWLRQISSESGGNPNAVQRVRDANSGGNEAVGLVQVIPKTFQAFKWPGMNDRKNPLASLLAGMGWAKHKYGVTGMLNVIGHGHGYAAGTPSAPGGWAMVGERGPELVRLPTGTQVHTAAQTAALRPNTGPQRVTGTLTLTDDSRAVIDGWIVDLIEDAADDHARRSI